MRVPRAILVTLIAAVLLAGCGGGGPGTAGTGATTAPTARASTATSPSADLPPMMGDFSRVCTTQVGYGAATAYAATPGLHPVELFFDHGDPPTLTESSATLPAGWTVTQDGDYADNGELAGVELVGCARRTTATPNGTKCDFKGANDGDPPLTLELVDTLYTLTVYASATGKQVGEPQTLEASDTECPMFASFRDGDTQLLNYPTDDQFINALKKIVNP